MTAPLNWEVLAEAIEAARRINRRIEQQDTGAISDSDQVRAAMRQWLDSIGVNIDDPVVVHTMIATCATVQRAAKQCHAAGIIDCGMFDGAMRAATAVVRVVAEFVPDEVLS